MFPTKPRTRHNGAMGTESTDAIVESFAETAVEVYWRPGCPYCNRLLRYFDDARVTYTLHNIWEDDRARQFVQSHNNGNETVPTVALFGSVVTNPDPRTFVDVLRLHHPELIDALP